MDSLSKPVLPSSLQSSTAINLSNETFYRALSLREVEIWSGQTGTDWIDFVVLFRDENVALNLEAHTRQQQIANKERFLCLLQSDCSAMEQVFKNKINQLKNLKAKEELLQKNNTEARLECLNKNEKMSENRSLLKAARSVCDEIRAAL